VKVGSQKGPKDITVSNTKHSGDPVLMEGVSGVAGTAYSVTDGCTAPLAPGAKCTIAVTFAPTTTGKQNVTLMILDNAKGEPQSVELKGKGKDNGK
jgi:trimeric autotransporter adhesin